MQHILGIDFSCQPCEFTLCQVDGSQVEVVARTTARLPIFTNREVIRHTDIRPILRNKGQDSTAPSLGSEGSSEATRDAPANADPDKVSVVAELVSQSIEEIKAALQSFQLVWSASTVILPQNDHMSLNLDLPFGDARNLDRIVDLEVQDVVPFELDEFFVQYSSLGATNTGSNAAQAVAASPNYDVHIGILPRMFVRNVLELCKAAGLEPNIITVPSSAIGAAYRLAKDFLKPNSALVFNRGDEYSIVISIRGEVKSQRSLFASQIIPASSPERKEENIRHIFTALKLILTSAERRYNTRIETVYLLGREVKSTNAQQLFGRPLEGLSFRDIIKSNEPQVGISSLGSIYAADAATEAPLSNFRAREFSFAPRIGEFIRALSGTKRQAIAAALGVVLSIAVVYASRQYTLISSQRVLLQQIQRVIKGFEAEPENIREALMRAEQSLGEELGAFGSRAKVTPADAFLEIVKNLPDSTEVAISSIRVSGIRVQLTGSAAELAAIERFVKTLNSRKDIFTKVEYKTTRIGQRFNATIDIVLTQ